MADNSHFLRSVEYNNESSVKPVGCPLSILLSQINDSHSSSSVPNGESGLLPHDDFPHKCYYDANKEGSTPKFYTNLGFAIRWPQIAPYIVGKRIPCCANGYNEAKRYLHPNCSVLECETKEYKSNWNRFCRFWRSNSIKKAIFALFGHDVAGANASWESLKCISLCDKHRGIFTQSLSNNDFSLIKEYVTLVDNGKMLGHPQFLLQGDQTSDQLNSTGTKKSSEFDMDLLQKTIQEECKNLSAELRTLNIMTVDPSDFEQAVKSKAPVLFDLATRLQMRRSGKDSRKGREESLMGSRNVFIYSIVMASSQRALPGGDLLTQELAKGTPRSTLAIMSRAHLGKSLRTQDKELEAATDQEEWITTTIPTLIDHQGLTLNASQIALFADDFVPRKWLRQPDDKGKLYSILKSYTIAMGLMPAPPVKDPAVKLQSLECFETTVITVTLQVASNQSYLKKRSTEYSITQTPKTHEQRRENGRAMLDRKTPRARNLDKFYPLNSTENCHADDLKSRKTLLNVITEHAQKFQRQDMYVLLGDFPEISRFIRLDFTDPSPIDQKYLYMFDLDIHFAKSYCRSLISVMTPLFQAVQKTIYGEKANLISSKSKLEQMEMLIGLMWQALCMVWDELEVFLGSTKRKYPAVAFLQELGERIALANDYRTVVVDKNGPKFLKEVVFPKYLLDTIIFGSGHYQIVITYTLCHLNYLRQKCPTAYDLTEGVNFVKILGSLVEYYHAVLSGRTKHAQSIDDIANEGRKWKYSNQGNLSEIFHTEGDVGASYHRMPCESVAENPSHDIKINKVVSFLKGILTKVDQAKYQSISEIAKVDQDGRLSFQTVIGNLPLSLMPLYYNANPGLNTQCQECGNHAMALTQRNREENDCTETHFCCRDCKKKFPKCRICDQQSSFSGYKALYTCCLICKSSLPAIFIDEPLTRHATKNTFAKPEDKIVGFPCGHVVHEKCSKSGTSCPICLKWITEKEGEVLTHAKQSLSAPLPTETKRSEKRDIEEKEENDEEEEEASQSSLVLDLETPAEPDVALPVLESICTTASNRRSGKLFKIGKAKSKKKPRLDI